MGKNKNKGVSRLRAEVEFLRAQLKNSGGLPERTVVSSEALAGKFVTRIFNGQSAQVSKTTVTYRIEPGQLRSDLKKTLFLTIFSLTFLFALYYSQPYLPALYSSINHALVNSPLKIPAIK